jgi:hypothetical protein
MEQVERVAKRYHDPFRFAWRIPECGFRFETRSVRGEKVRCLMHAADHTRYKWQRPLETHTGLFKEFTSVNLDEASIVKFANQFGWLQGDEIVPDQSNHLAGSDTSAFWFSEITEMRRLVNLWERVQSDDLHYLKTHIIYGKVSIQLKVEDISAEIASRDDPAFDELQNDVVWTALTYIGRCINKKLDNYHVTARLMQDRNTDRELTLFINPSSLISGLWFQFARAVEKNRQYRACEWCGVPFVVGGKSAGGKRSDSKFCTPSHKAAAGQKPIPRSKPKQKHHGRKRHA